LLSHARTLEARVKERTRELRQANRELHRLAHTDALTRLPNRLHFMTLFHQRFAHAQRHEHSFAVLLMDLDGFKGINDDYGHAAGDTALETVARRVSNAVRGGDTFSRLGGDEFALLVEEFDHPEDLQSVAEKITALVAAPFSWKGHRLELGGSIGIAVHDGSAETEAENLLQAADVAMYRAKRDRLPYAFADSGITPAMATSPRK